MASMKEKGNKGKTLCSPYTTNKYSSVFDDIYTYYMGQVADACECGNEPSGSIKCGEFLD